MKTRAAWAGHALADPDRLRAALGPVDAPGPMAMADAAAEFDIACITGDFNGSRWTGEWRRLLAASLSPEKIYQTPEFFRFLHDTQSRSTDRFALYVVTRRPEGKVVGMVPVRISRTPLAIKLGSVPLATWHPSIVRILGSVPLMPDHPALAQLLFAHLLRAHPACAAVSMQAFPIERQAYLAAGMHPSFILHGWRACHTIPLPADWLAYLAQLSAKKRYNLGRQYRLLAESTGPLTLVRVDRSREVQTLVDSQNALAPQDGQAQVHAREFRVLAANRLLLSYVLKSADEVVAVIAGTRYGDTWHVHQIRYAPRYRHLSAGAVALHAALDDVVTHFAFTVADLGYGTPRHPFASTNVLATRAHVLVARAHGWQRRLLSAFIRYDACHAACVRLLKPFAQRLLKA